VARAVLTLEDLELEGKTVFVRADLNSPVDPKTGRLMDISRLQEATLTLRDLAKRSKVVLASHQGRVGRSDYISLDQHAKELAKLLGRQVEFVMDVMGEAALRRIRELQPGDILLLDNLRFVAEENMEFGFEEAKRTVLVRRLAPLLDGVVLDAFPTAHRAHPSIVGLSEVLPAAAGRLVVKELKALERLENVTKGPFVALLGGAKVGDRLEAIEQFVRSGKVEKVLVAGLLAGLFLKAKGFIKHPLGLEKEDEACEKVRGLLANYPELFELPSDVAVDRNGERVEVPVEALRPGEAIYDLGSNTIERYARFILGAGTVFVSGPPGLFEREEFSEGTRRLLEAVASSYATTVVSGGHLNAALQRYGIRDSIDLVSTAGGALVLYLAGRRLPMLEALQRAYERWRRQRLELKAASG
jgi:phosphoglycerate kinase